MAPNPLSDPARHARRFGALVSCAMVAAVLSPLFTGGPDSFPISSFPMFAHVRTSPLGTITHVLAVLPDGSSAPLPPELVANSSSLQALLTLEDTVRRGPASSMALCRDVAERARAAGAIPGVSELRLETATYDAVAYFDGQREPLEAQVHARCPVASEAP